MKVTTQVNIRQATIADKKFILSLVPRLTEFGPPSWRDGDQMIKVDLQVLNEKLTSSTPDSAIFIAQDESNLPLGFIHIHSGSDYYYKKKHAHISDLIVATEAEGKGIGKVLMEEAEKWALLNNFSWITLSVFAQNVRAREKYERLGYGQDLVKYVKEIK